VREVAEEDPEVGLRVGEPPGLRATPAVRARIDADELHSPSAKLDGGRLVDEQPRGCKVAEADGAGERIARMLDVVVAEDDERPVAELRDDVPQHRLATRPRDEVAGDRDEVGLAARSPLRGMHDGARTARRETEVEVREVDDPQTRQLRW